MRHAVAAALVAMTLATPAAAQSVQQLLQGLTSGNKNQDEALHQAYERGYQRGYQRGREDEARLRSGRTGDNARRNVPYDRNDPDNPDYRNGQGYARPPQGQDDNYGR